MQSEAKNAQDTGAARGLLRAALLGLSGGMLLGGLALLIIGLYTRVAPVDCTDLSNVQCGFARDAAVEMGRFQSLMGAGLLALGIAGGVLLARPKKSTPAA
ncbi:hypothetical protein [Melittangium boletus]|uniref:Uncharacterized protein n=1 Tax=Melittangium boletus DSM 14713 TaxID=1294270 RepID=A0A250IKM1_9BACT|nr:hypothetical protein [Melittangium boletus]ATB31476.1 hypothetical protein MEBOL_004939 [Melittangium boletus DSM 14713]